MRIKLRLIPARFQIRRFWLKINPFVFAVSTILRRLFSTSVIGGGLALINYKIFEPMIYELKWDPLLANVTLFSISSLINFYLNYRFTWGDRRQGSIWKKVGMFGIVKFTLVLFNAFLFWLCQMSFSASQESSAYWFALAITMVVGFYYNHRFVYKEG